MGYADYHCIVEDFLRYARAAGKLDVSKAVCAGLCGMAVYGVVGFLAIRDVIGIGNVVMMDSAVTMLIAAFSELAMIFTDLRNNNVHLLNYFRYMDMEEEKTETEKEETAAPSPRSGGDQPCEIVFEKVSFQYPGSRTMVLQDINLRVLPGEKLAIVGENGSGKTTLIKLLCRLYRPTSGQILLNGVDIWNYPYEQYIRKIATVFQDFSLFAFSIAENVAASREYDGEKVYEALCRAGLQKKIHKLSKGIRQAISHDYEEDGMDLSGGEAQKAAIARAIYKAAPVVILDEPTAALDPYAEKEIHERFFENLANETMLSISHRLSSCRLCDRIIVLHGGRLVQQGSHRELLRETDGKYARLWEMQAQYY
jgi:ATP-binding cassette subfamily B protein